MNNKAKFEYKNLLLIYAPRMAAVGGLNLIDAAVFDCSGNVHREALMRSVFNICCIHPIHYSNKDKLIDALKGRKRVQCDECLKIDFISDTQKYCRYCGNKL